MEDIKERIIEYAITLNPSLEESDYLDLIVTDVINKAVIYMNRLQLLNEEEDNWDRVLPIILETSLAQIVVKTDKAIQYTVDAETNKLKRITDGQQTVEYSDVLLNYLSSASDAEIFFSIKGTLDKFRIPTVVGYDNTNRL